MKAINIIMSVCMMMVVTTSTFADFGSVIQDGADRLVDKQGPGGSWGWPLEPTTEYTNVGGPIGMGLLHAYGMTSDSAHLDAAKAFGDRVKLLTGDWVGTYNPYFMTQLGAVSGDSSYTAKAEEFYSELIAGTYTRQTVDHDTAAWITQVQTGGGRDSTWINLRPWEFAPLAMAADTAGTVAQKDAFVQAIKDGIETLDSSDPGAVYADILGLAGGVMGLSSLGIDFDPTAGAFAGASSTADLADTLAGLQNANGSWDWHTNIAAPTSDDEDLQTTPYAMLALLAANDLGQYNAELLLGHNYLVGMQNVDGGWPSYPGGGEYAEIDGEIVWALAAPEPASLGLLAVGSLMMIRRKG